MNHSLNFTDNAAAKVWSLICEEGNYNLKLRVYVTGGGCSGFQYGFTFDENKDKDDIVVAKKVVAEKADTNVCHAGESLHPVKEDGEVHLLIDPLSFQYLAGATIDYKEDIEGEQFIIQNPNAKTTCGCGSSFTVD